MMLVDSHCHLDFPEFSDLDSVVSRARSAGVHRMVTISTRLSKFSDVLSVSEHCDEIFCSVGVHPHYAADESVTVESLVELSSHKKVVAIGESGLDYHYENSPRSIQHDVFLVHIEAARLTGLPLVIHARDADSDMIDILTEQSRVGSFSAVLHCFSSSRALAERGIELGFYVSFSGILTFKNSDDLRILASDLPRDRVLIETDSPYLSPVPHRGKPNEPSYVSYVADVLGDIWGVSRSEVCSRTTDNFFSLFTKVPS